MSVQQTSTEHFKAVRARLNSGTGTSTELDIVSEVEMRRRAREDAAFEACKVEARESAKAAVTHELEIWKKSQTTTLKRISTLLAEAKILRADARMSSGLSNPWVAEIQLTVARKFQVRVTDLLAARRDEKVILPRHIAMYLAKTLTRRSLPEIGRRFGGRDHTTILHAVRKIERMRKTDAALDALIENLETELRLDVDRAQLIGREAAEP